MIDYKGVDFSKILKRYDVEAQNETTPEAVAKKMLPADPVLKNVAECVLYMKFKDVGPATSEALKTHKPLDIINNGLVVGMECVAKPGGREAKATVVMHAAEGDPHDIGKNIAAVMMRSAGYNVIDMGKDVAVTDAVAKCVEVKPLFISGTALMTTTMTAFPRVAQGLIDAGMNIPMMGCGGAVNRDYANSYDLGIYSEKAPQTPLIADKILAGYDWKRVRDEWDDIVGA